MVIILSIDDCHCSLPLPALTSMGVTITAGMKKDVYLDFILKGVRDLQTALLTDQSEADLHFPTSICVLWQIDENENLLFRLPRPYLDMSGCAPEMHLQLQFFNSRLPYCILVEGKAVLLRMETAMMLFADQEQTPFSETEILVCFTIEKADYVVQREKRRPSIFARLRLLFQWLFPERVDHSRNISLSV